MDLFQLVSFISGVIAVLAFFGITHIRQLRWFFQSSSESNAAVDTSYIKRMKRGAAWGALTGGVAGLFVSGIGGLLVMGFSFMVFFGVTAGMANVVKSIIGGAIFGGVVGLGVTGGQFDLLVPGVLVGAIWAGVFWTWLN